MSKANTSKWFTFDCHEFKIGWFVGIVMEIFLIITHEIGYSHVIETVGADIFMNLYINASINDRSVPFIFVDIDDHTYQRWESPPGVPRDQLATLITKTIDQHPEILIVDVDLGFPSCEKNEDVFNAVRNANSTLPVILFQGLESIEESEDRSTDEFSLEYFRPRCDSYMDILSDFDNVYWAFPVALADDNLVVREWMLATPLMMKDNVDATAKNSSSGKSTTIDPGVGLTAYALLSCKREVEVTGILTSVCREVAGASPRQITGWFVGAVLSRHQINSRIVFTIPWRVDAAAKQPLKIPLFTRISATKIYDDDLDEIEQLKGRGVWIIGGSYFDSRDMHATPIGLMPGAVILINGINSLISFDIVETPSLWFHLALGVVLSGIVAGIFATLELCGHKIGLGWHTAVGLSFVIFIGIGMGYWMLQSGTWADATLPVLAVFAHRYLGGLWSVVGRLWSFVADEE